MQVDAFLLLKTKSGDLTGETTDKTIVEAIEISEFRTGRDFSLGYDIDHLPREGGRKRKYAPFGFEIRKDVDAASPQLFHAYCTTYAGAITADVNLFESAEVSFRKSGGGATMAQVRGGTLYLKMEFTKVLLISYTLSNASAGVPNESVTFAFETCKMQYHRQGRAGQTQPAPDLKGWDFRYNCPA